VTFRTPDAFREWLQANHTTQSELILRCFKVHATHRGVGYREALDEALCFGWIDGVRGSLDPDSFSVRFTPRKPSSYWSAVNTKRYRELVADGRVRAPGRKVFEARVKSRDSTKDSFKSRNVMLAPALAEVFRANRAAWAFYQSRPPWYRRTSASWVMSAKLEETQQRRLATLVSDCANGRTLKALTRKSASGRKKK
jgi:uncharacterized protein YdeI (YjbR/CyaY-like superfamily)